MKDLRIDLRGQCVELTAVSYLRGWIAYQGADYFEFRPDGTGGWLLSQSEEWDYHDPLHVVGRGATLQAAAEDFAHSITRQLGTRSGPPSATRGRDLVAASIDDLLPVLGAATRLGYRDGGAGLAARTGNAIASVLGLASWSGLQQMQLRQAYMAGRQHGVSERRREISRATAAGGSSPRSAPPIDSARARPATPRGPRTARRVRPVSR